jgi:hypothetical protein
MHHPTTDRPRNRRISRRVLSPDFLDEIAMTRSEVLAAREVDVAVGVDR